jgi:hypothetical protein
VAVSQQTIIHSDGNGNANRHLETGFFVHRGVRSAVKRVKFICDTMSYIILRGHWCDTKDGLRGTGVCIQSTVHVSHENIWLGNFNTKVGREDILKPKNRNENLNEIINGNGVKL